MNRSSVLSTIRWAIIVPAAIVGFFISMILAIPLNGLIHYLLWSSGQVLDGKMFLLYVLPYDGALAATFFILFGTYAAPRKKTLVALCLLTLGGIIAWQLVGTFYSPHFSKHGPIRIWWPIIGTYFGGLCTFAIICCTSSPKTLLKIV